MQISAQKVHYSISFPNPQNHYCLVNMEFIAPTNNPLVGLPVWTPGSYLVREYSKNLEKIEAMVNNKPGKIVKTDKNHWTVTAKKKEKVSISYLIYCNEVSVRTNFITAEHAFITPAATCMYVKGMEAEAHAVKVIPSPNWKKIACGLSDSKDPFIINASNYDLLVDAPIEVGNHDEFSFMARGIEHKVAMVGANNADYNQLAKDMQKIVETTINVFDELPVKNYTFIVQHVENGGGGLEHLNSTVLMMTRNNYADKEKYINFLSLVAHEYFHLWNVKRMRPEALGPFNYDVENYTEMLWFFEGFTAYYDELILFRAGYIDEKAYLKRVTDNIEKNDLRGGSMVQTVAEASYDAWIKAYRPDENSANTTISYYGKGAVIATLLDIKICSATNGKKNLDQLMQALYAKYKTKPTKGFTQQDIYETASQIAETNLDTFFNALVHSTQKADYTEYFSLAGLQYNEILNLTKPYLGTSSKNIDGKITVQSVHRNTPAYQAGINVGDEYIAINGQRIRDIQTMIDLYKIGEEIAILLARDGIIKTIQVKIGVNPNGQITLIDLENPSEQQKIVKAKWLQL